VGIETLLQRIDGPREPLPGLPVEVRLQACSDAICLAPETLTLRVPVERP
jgi:hypothetical protein